MLQWQECAVAQGQGQNQLRCECYIVMLCREMSSAPHIHHHQLGDNHGAWLIVVSQKILVDDWILLLYTPSSSKPNSPTYKIK